MTDKGPSNRSHLPALHALAEVGASLGKRAGVRGFYIGQKMTDGEYGAGCSVVCIVDKKLPKSKLSRSERIPKRLSFEELGHKRQIQTDVLQNHRTISEQGLFNPGDPIRGVSREDNTVRATVGAFGVHTDFGPVFVTAGHFTQILDRRRTIRIADRRSASRELINVRIRSVVRANGIDYALLAPTGGASNASFRNVPIVSSYQPILRSDVGQRLFVLARGQQVPTICRGLNMTYRVPRTGEVLENLIVTDPVTVRGDSGGALVDEHFRLWGLVIGVASFRSGGRVKRASIYMPAFKFLSMESMVLGGP